MLKHVNSTDSHTVGGTLHADSKSAPHQWFLAASNFAASIDGSQIGPARPSTSSSTTVEECHCHGPAAILCTRDESRS
eukprot:2542579-Rhodomonas_salina.5